jgi:Zn-finger nucleic acid-binding protein
MSRIVCPHCHVSLSSTELEQVAIVGHLCLVCPECSTVLVSQPHNEVDAHQPAEAVAHA